MFRVFVPCDEPEPKYAGWLGLGQIVLGQLIVGVRGEGRTDCRYAGSLRGLFPDSLRQDSVPIQIAGSVPRGVFAGS